MDFVYAHSSPSWYWCGLSAVVLSEEDYTEEFYMIHEGYVPSVQYEMNLRWSKAMREVGPNFIFIDFIVPALGPRLN
jgi:hypothetical protein